MKDRCESCYFRRGSTDGWKVCVWWEVVGQIRPCPPGDACTVYKRKGRKRQEVNSVRDKKETGV